MGDLEFDEWIGEEQPSKVTRELGLREHGIGEVWQPQN